MTDNEPIRKIARRKRYYLELRDNKHDICARSSFPLYEVQVEELANLVRDFIRRDVKANTIGIFLQKDFDDYSYLMTADSEDNPSKSE
jgi:hypothetical protein